MLSAKERTNLMFTQAADACEFASAVNERAEWRFKSLEERRKQRTNIFVSGPVEQVEDELAALDNGWTAMEFWYHVLNDKACVTVRLVPTALLARAQLNPGISRMPQFRS